MGWFGKLTFGTMGLLFGGPLGAIAGAALGHMLLDKKTGYPGQDTRSIPGPEFGQAEQAQATYFISLFSILGNRFFVLRCDRIYIRTGAKKSVGIASYL